VVVDDVRALLLQHNTKKPCHQIHDGRQSQCYDSDTVERDRCHDITLIQFPWQLCHGPPPAGGVVIHNRKACSSSRHALWMAREFSDGGDGTGRNIPTTQLSVLLQEQRTLPSWCKSCLFLGPQRWRPTSLRCQHWCRSWMSNS
jgi:hypothetical protein